MNKIMSIFVLFCLSILLKTINCHDYDCSSTYGYYDDDYTTDCSISDIKLSKTDVINPYGSNLHNIQSLKIRGSIPVLQAQNICEKLSDLQQIDVSSCQIEIIEEDQFKSCTSLNFINLQHNNLFEFDAEIFLQHVPKLTKINFVDNNFECAKLDDIISTIKSKGIAIGTSYSLDNLRKRNYTINQKVSGIDCLSEEQVKIELKSMYGNILTDWIHHKINKISNNHDELKENLQNSLNQTISVVEDKLEEQKSFFEILIGENFKLLNATQDDIKRNFTKFILDQQNSLQDKNQWVFTQIIILYTIFCLTIIFIITLFIKYRISKSVQLNHRRNIIEESIVAYQTKENFQSVED